jgi:2',3'-cyclic-nucleotide 2'-phosphodiesterase / 3'-nucleotidase / 5'-nucleotidase
MTRWSSILGALALLLVAPSAEASEVRLDEVVARAPREVVVRSAVEDNPLLELLQRAQLQSTGADVALAFPVPVGTRLAAGPITGRAALALAPDARVTTVEMSFGELRAALERSAAAFHTYRWRDGDSLIAPGDEARLVFAEGVSYEVDLTAPAGARVVHLAWRGAEPDSSRRVKVAGTVPVFETIGRRVAVPDTALRLRDAVLAQLRKAGTVETAVDHNWSLIPDYVTVPERPLIDRLVRLGAAPREEVMRLFPDQPARRGDLAYWLARAYGWRESKLSGAYSDLPDSLEPWVDGLVKRRVIGAVASEEYFHPFAPVRLPMALEWCENAARHARYALDSESDRGSFRRGLLTGTSLSFDRDSVSRAALLGLVANARFPEVRVLETTDFHGAMLPDSGPPPRPGSAALVRLVERLRRENQEGTVLLDGGDAFQGTMISNLYFGRAVVEQMNRLHYDAMAIGNHEFDWSVDTLVRRIEAMHFATLGANIVEASTGRRPWWSRPDTLLHRRGVRVGVAGLAFSRTPTVTHPQNVRTLRFGDEVAMAKQEAPALRARGADAVIGLGHVPGTIDSAHVLHGVLASVALVPGFDAWLGGHSHNWVDGEVRGIPAMISGSSGAGVAVCDLVVDPIAHRVVERRHRLVRASIDPAERDSAMEALVARWEKGVESEAGRVVGASAQRLGRRGGGESAVGSLVADVMRAAVGADVAFQNGGGLRSDLPAGPLTRSAIFEVMPFENTVVTMNLSGDQIRQVLEEGLAEGRVIQVSGIRYRFDFGRAKGARITALSGEHGEPLDPRRTFKVACNDFMAAGGDDMVTLSRTAWTDTGILVRDALESGVRERSKAAGGMRYEEDGRIAREPGSPSTAREN